MKINFQLCSVAGISCLLACQAVAIDAPSDETPPPQLKVNPPATVAPADEKAYIGIVSTEIPELLASHIGIQPSEGIMVKSTMPDGPAAAAGIQQYDIITHASDQAIHTPAEFSRSVSQKKPGETLRLRVIHKGKSTEKQVTLGARPAAQAGLQNDPLDRINLRGVPKELAERMRSLIENNIGSFNFPADPIQRIAPDIQIDEALRDMKNLIMGTMPDDQAKDDLPPAPPPSDDVLQIQQDATIRVLDESGSVEMKSTSGINQVTVRDENNNVIWSGPWTTANDKTAAPPDIRSRIERLNLEKSFPKNSNGFKLPKGSPPPGGD